MFLKNIYIKKIFFYFLKFIFNINVLKRFKNIKKKIKILKKAFLTSADGP
jgi:hypothetical protein